MYEINKQKFGSFVSQLRKEQGLTQKELAQKLYISDKAVSKWETGVSIPDVTLLIPLAELLDVTVSELLECRRMEQKAPMETAQVEQLVQKAIRFIGEDAPPEDRRRNLAVFISCTAAALLELLFLHFNGHPVSTWSDALQLSFIFGILFGGYFLLLAKPRLPPYHDQYQINGVIQGAFRMNIPGVHFNNRNWPHILRVGQIWSMMYMVGYPAAYYLLYRLLPDFWPRWETYVMLTLILGGLFIPIVVVGRKFE